MAGKDSGLLGTIDYLRGQIRDISKLAADARDERDAARADLAAVEKALANDRERAVPGLTTARLAAACAQERDHFGGAYYAALGRAERLEEAAEEVVQGWEDEEGYEYTPAEDRLRRLLRPALTEEESRD